jgi:uncharacterized RDD family membrane protein YckC
VMIGIDPHKTSHTAVAVSPAQEPAGPATGPGVGGAGGAAAGMGAGLAGAGLGFIARWMGRLGRRRYAGPPGLADGLRSRAGTGPRGEGLTSPVTPVVIQMTLVGRCAGFASRFAAFIVDVGASVGVFMLALAAVSFAARILTGQDIAWNRGDIWVVVAYAAWEFAYFAYCRAASGRTAGMALFGVRVVGHNGSDAGGRRAVVRALAFPLSFVLLGLGFVGILLGGRRRALHDVIAGTAVIYSWDARAARLRFLSRG